VTANPLSYRDPYGLSKEGLEFMLGQVQRTYSDIQPNGSIELGSVPIGINGQTNKWTGDIVMSSDLFSKKECLSRKEWEYVFWTLFHEAMHSTDNWWTRRSTTNDRDDVHHNSIYNRESVEMGKGKEYPSAPIWGTPRNKRANMDDLYQQYFNKSPDCQCKK
jgi:hypothetical protein